MQTDGEHGGGPAAPSIVAVLRARAAEALSFHPRETVALAVLGLLLLGGATLAYVRARPSAAAAPIAAIGGEPSADVSASPAGGPIVVHVVGAVKRPGVYEFAKGARVIEAVRAAGGLRSDADAAAINMARTLADGEQIVVPREGESPPQAGGSAPTSGTGGGDQVNLNTALATELETLPGIGPALAQRIIDYREQHGPFRAVRDLLKVSGIGPKKFEALESLVTV